MACLVVKQLESHSLKSLSWLSNKSHWIQFTLHSHTKGCNQKLWMPLQFRSGEALFQEAVNVNIFVDISSRNCFSVTVHTKDGEEKPQKAAGVLAKSAGCSGGLRGLHEENLATAIGFIDSTLLKLLWSWTHKPKIIKAPIDELFKKRLKRSFESPWDKEYTAEKYSGQLNTLSTGKLGAVANDVWNLWDFG